MNWTAIDYQPISTTSSGYSLPILLLMLKLLLFATCLIPAMATAEFDKRLIYWKKLLHYGEHTSRVVSSKFFITAKGARDYQFELIETIRQLKSPAGQEIACRFPARYRWLQSNYTDIPQYQLKDCAELSSFVEGFQKQTVSLSFASEYLNNPVSSFGHTMLVFHDEDKPLLSADAVHFAAISDESDNYFAYTWNGLTGAYPGYFFRDAFFKKQHQYNIIEQRYLHLYSLDFTSQQIEDLIYHLYELRNATYKYYFINENCAYQIAILLDLVTNRDSFSDSTFVLPIEVAKAYKDLHKYKRVLYPTSVQVNYILDEMSDIEQSQFQAVLDGELHPDDTLSNRVKYTLNLYYEYDFRKKHVTNPHYDKVVKLNYSKPNLNIDSAEPLNKQSASKVSAGYIHNRRGDGVLLAYRPLIRDLIDTQQDNQASELILFNPVMQINNEATYLQQLDLISIKSLPTRSRYFKPISWQFYTGLNRNNPEEKLNYETEIGIGLSNRLSLINLTYAINIGSDFTTGDSYYKPDLTLLANFGDYFKIGFNAYEKYYEDKKYIERTIFTTLRFGQYALNMNYSNTTSSDVVISVNLFHYF